MSAIDEKVANEICFDDQALDPGSWFKQEVYDLALRFAGLDEVPVSALLSLAQLAARGPMDEKSLVRLTGLNLLAVESDLEALCEYHFVKECSAGHEVTDRGMEVFRTFGTNLITRKRLEMKGRYEALDRLYKTVQATWYR